VTTQPLRAAIIGCGRVATSIEDEHRQLPGRWSFPHTHAGAWRALPDVALVAGADPNPAARAAFERRWGPVETFADYHDMLVTVRPDLVSVTVHAPLHAEVVIACARAGVRGIWCEKALATSLLEADAMLKACADSGTVLAVNTWRRHDPVFERAHGLVHEGAIGALRTIVFSWSGALAHTGSHYFDLVCMFAGAPAAWVSASMDPGWTDGTDSGGMGMIQFTNGVRALVNGCAGQQTLATLELYGSNGVIHVSDHGGTIWSPVAGEHGHAALAARPITEYWQESYMLATARDVVRCVREGGEPSPSGTDGRAALELAIAFHEAAAQGGARVPLPLANRARVVRSR
jgi:predicted dehydrogenase